MIGEDSKRRRPISESEKLDRVLDRLETLAAAIEQLSDDVERLRATRDTGVEGPS